MFRLGLLAESGRGSFELGWDGLVMSQAIMSSVGIAAYLALFVGIAVVFLLVNLLIGSLVRPKNPHPEKLEIYECGEPAIGSSYVQFDLRFYVIALLFIIFDVEVAFFFPWATLFGKAMHLADESPANVAVVRQGGDLALSAPAAGILREMGVREPQVPRQVPSSLESEVTEIEGRRQAEEVVHRGARQLGVLSSLDILVFFLVLIIGFAYVWKRGDLDWVRVSEVAPVPRVPPPPAESEPAEEPVLLA